MRQLHLEASQKHQDNDNYEDQSQSSARVVSPTTTVWPRRQSTQQEQDQDNDQNRSHRVPPELRLDSLTMQALRPCLRCLTSSGTYDMPGPSYIGLSL